MFDGDAPTGLEHTREQLLLSDFQGYQMIEEQKLTEAGEWYRNRDEWVRHVIGRPYLTDAQRLIATFIAMHINRVEEHTKHQQTTIAKDLNLSVGTVKKATKKLIEEGLIARNQIRRGQRNRAVNQYRLIFPWS